jgi:hypothetical protein
LEKREELLKSVKFAEKFLGGLTQEHYKSEFEKMVEEDEAEDDLFIWESFFKKEKTKDKAKNEDDDLFPWGFLFEDKRLDAISNMLFLGRTCFFQC